MIGEFSSFDPLSCFPEKKEALRYVAYNYNTSGLRLFLSTCKLIYRWC